MKFFALSFLAAASLVSTLQAKPNNNATGFKFPPPQQMTARREPMQHLEKAPAATESLTIVGIASSNASLSNFTKALEASGLLDTLQRDSFTIFAPNDQAFAKLSPNTLDDLMQPANKDKLSRLLSAHIVPGKLTIADIKAGPVKTLNGTTLNIHKGANGDLKVNNANLVQEDIVGSNGVIHIIDTVVIQ